MLASAKPPTTRSRHADGVSSAERRHLQEPCCYEIATPKQQLTSRPKSPLDKPGSSCDNFIVNNQTIDFKLRWVERCLAQLVDEGDFGEQHEVSPYNQDRRRVKVLLQIYAKLLKCPPAPLDLVIRVSPDCFKPACLNDARQQVLSLIEHLAGYCDSINSLRCILKSSHMIAVIASFDTILRRICDISSQTCELTPTVEDWHEFRIVQEWRF